MFAWLGGAKKRAQMRRKQHAAASTAMYASAPIPPPPLNNNNHHHQDQEEDDEDYQELHIQQQPIKQVQISLRDSLIIHTGSFKNHDTSHHHQHHHKSLDLMVMEFPDQHHKQQPSAIMSTVD
jgi:hypothetical protein